MAGTYLLLGKEGYGHFHLALSITALVNCQSPEKQTEFVIPCGKCSSCRKIFSINFEGLSIALALPPHKNEKEAVELYNGYLDEKRKEPFLIFKSSSSRNIPISSAREIKRRLSLKSVPGIKRVVLFYQMELMKQASADALLKLIEEPPLDSILILTTEKADYLLPTIQSRSQKIILKRINVDIIGKYISEKYDLSQNKAELIMKISDGSLGEAVAMASDNDEEGNSQRALSFLLFKSLLTESPASTVSHLNEMIPLNDRGYIESMLSLWQSLLRDCLIYQETNRKEEIINIDFSSDIIKFAQMRDGRQRNQAIVENLKITLADMRRNVHIQGALTAMVLRIKTNQSNQTR